MWPTLVNVVPCPTTRLTLTDCLRTFLGRYSVSKNASFIQLAVVSLMRLIQTRCRG